MIIDHPLLGPRDISEFIYLGDASLLNRPKWNAEDAEHHEITKVDLVGNYSKNMEILND